MATFDLTLTDADAGRVMDVRDGFLVSLSMTRPPAVPHPMPRNGVHFTLRDDRSLPSGLRNLISYDPHNWGAFGGVLWLNNSIPYVGELKVVSVPPGSEWSLTLSDTPVRKRAA